MSGLKFLYKNSNFKNSTFKENHKFSSDFFIDNLNNLLQDPKTTAKKKKPQFDNDEVSSRKFSEHPRCISDDSLTSTSVDLLERPIFTKKSNSTKTKGAIKKNDLFLESTEYEKLLMDVTPLYNSDSFNLINSSEKISETSIQMHVKKAEVPKKKIFNQTEVKKQERTHHLKLNPILVKTALCMQDIGIVVESGILPVESAEDQIRREKRTMGFFTRFARNYLYQIGRQIHTVRDLSARPSTSSIVLVQKIFNIGQLILQALQAYQHHVRLTIVCSVHSKIQQLISYIEDFCAIAKKGKITNGINVTIATIDEIEDGCKYLMPLIQIHLIKKPIELARTNTIPNAPSTSLMHIPKTRTSSGLPFQKKHTLENRLKMYTVAFKRNPNAWKKSAVVLAKQRFSKVQVKAVLPPPPATHQQQLPEKKITINTIQNDIGRVLVEKRSSQVSSCVNQLVNEDELETLVELHQNKPGSLMTMAKDEINNKLEPLLRNLLTEITKQHKDELMDGMVYTDTLEKLQGLMDQMKVFTVDSNQENEDETKEQVVVKEKQNSGVKITGTRNAQLICIKDKSCFKTDTATIAPAQTKETKETQEPARSPVLRHLAKNYTVNIIQYKLQFHKYTKHNHMYKKTNTIQPWLLTNKISDELIRFVLTSVLDEMRLNKIADSVYKSEFVLY